MTFSAQAALAGLPLGLALGCLVQRAIAAWPPDSTAAWPAGGVRLPSRTRRRGGGSRFPFPAWGHAALIAAGSIVLGWTHPRPDWAGWSQAVLLWSFLYAIAVIDLRALVVDLRLVALGLALRLLSLLWLEREALLPMVGGMLIAAGFFHILGLFYEVLRGRRGLGEGDPGVAGLVGAFVGWESVLPLVALAAAGGLVAGIPWLTFTRRAFTSPIPFAPFLCAAGLAIYLARLHGWTGLWFWG
jgi:leader peptidase (prepilin peptidase)/N-methyltransferase